MEKWKKRTVELLSSITLGSSGCPSVVPYEPSKTKLPKEEQRYFKRSAPEKFGISSKRLFNMLCELENEPRANIHNLMVLCDGEVILECSRDGFGTNLWHLSHSMSKSVVSMLVGILIDEGKLTLESKVAELFPEFTYKDKRFAKMTVEHLLNMTSGASFNEAGSVSETEWTEAFFASSLRFAPGAKFSYNSMNTYILARIVDRISVRGFGEFLYEKLFSPLRIENYFWEKGPEGCEKGGWGLYMSAESFAKLGYTYLCGGVFEGRRILSQWWIDLSLKTHALSPELSGDFNYGYQIWVARRGDDYLFNGMLGQNVWVCPKNRIVAVVMGGNNELFSDSPALLIVRKYLGGIIRDELSRRDLRVLRAKESEFFDCRRWVRPRERKRGVLFRLGIKTQSEFDNSWEEILGEYQLSENNSGLLPLIVRTMQNNLDATLESFTLLREGEKLILKVRESDREYTVEVGLFEYKSAVFDFRGEKYIVRCMGECFINSSGVREWRIEMIFPELPNTRYITLTRKDSDRVNLCISESPNHKIVENIFSRLSEVNTHLSFITEILERRFGEGVVSGLVKKSFEKNILAVDRRSDRINEILDDQRRKKEAEAERLRLIRGFVARFFSDADKISTAREGKGEDSRRSFVSNILDKFSARK